VGWVFCNRKINRRNINGNLAPLLGPDFGQLLSVGNRNRFFQLELGGHVTTGLRMPEIFAELEKNVIRHANLALTHF
jgi:hypothetical protein